LSTPHIHTLPYTTLFRSFPPSNLYSIKAPLSSAGINTGRFSIFRGLAPGLESTNGGCAVAPTTTTGPVEGVVSEDEAVVVRAKTDRKSTSLNSSHVKNSY